MTAPSAKLHNDFAKFAAVQLTDGPVRRVGATCQTAIEGRRAIRILGQWSERFQLTEPELQILWCLRDAATGGVDQTTLATRLAYSPAQVSACVEKLRARGLIMQHEAPGDRRRRLWQLAAGGSDLIQRTVQIAGEASLESSTVDKCANAASMLREAAA